MAYAAVYVNRADVEAEMGTELVSALNDSKQVPPAEQDGLWDKLAEAVDAKVSAAVSMIASLGRATPPTAFLRDYACITMCSLLYRRRGLVGERNPYDAREKELNDQLDAIADGKTYSGSFAHLAINDAESNVFMEDADASASSSSGGGGGGAGVSSLNGETGAVTISAGNNITVTTDGGNITIDGKGGGVESVNTLTGAVTIAAGTGISVTPGEKNELTIANTATPTTVNGKSGAVTLTAGNGISIWETTGTGANGVTINSTAAGNYVPLYSDQTGAKTAVTIGDRGVGNVGANSLAQGLTNVASGNFSHAEGYKTEAGGQEAHSEGAETVASGYATHAAGWRATASHDCSSVWNGDNGSNNRYYSHGEGTWNINPKGGISKAYIGETPLSDHIDTRAVSAVEAANLSKLKLNGETITEWPSGNAAAVRVIATASGTVQDGDDLILMDTATAGQAQTLTLPASLEADAATVTVRQLGDYGVTIAHGANEYRLTYAGDWVTLDWVAGKGWFWRA